MPESCGNHARNGSSCFEEDDSLVGPTQSARCIAHAETIGTYSKPLSRVHGVPAFPQLLEGHRRIGWDLFMFIPGNEIESPSARRRMGVGIWLVLIGWYQRTLGI